MRKEDLSFDTTFDPCQFSLDINFKFEKPKHKEIFRPGKLLAGTLS